MKAWAESLGGITTYPLLSDFWPHGNIAQLYGVLRSDGKSERALFVIDKNGVIRYVDVHDIDDQPDNDVLLRVLAQVEGVHYPEKQPEAEAPAPATAAAAPDNGQGAAPDIEVVMYCTDWCPACRRARSYFRQNGIRFKEINIARDREAAARVRSWANGNETTPTFDVGGTVVLNFNLTKLNEALGIQGY